MSRRKDDHASGVKPKEKIPVTKTKVTKHKPKNHPKRPLSAYNYFFRDQRAAIVAAIAEKEKDDKKPEGRKKSDIVTEYKVELDDATTARLKKEDGSVSFPEVGKLIGEHWRSGIDPERLARYNQMSKMDGHRYNMEMREFNRRNVARISEVPGHAPRVNEDFKVPPASTATRASAFSSVVPPSYHPYGGMSSFITSQQSVIPSNYAQYGMGTGLQGTIGAAMPSGRFGYAATSLSNVYGRQMGEGQGNSSKYVTPQTVSTRGSFSEGRHWGRANPSQSSTGVSVEGSTLDWMRLNYQLSINALRGSGDGNRPIQASPIVARSDGTVEGNHPGARMPSSEQPSQDDEQKSW